MNCSRNCNQGRSCSCPLACELPELTEEDEMQSVAETVLICIFSVVGTLAAATVIYQLLDLLQ